MMFDVVRFCMDNGIPYWTEGKNVSTTGDFVNIQCLFCGDRSNHLGIYKGSATQKSFGVCWKCGKHSIYDILQRLVPGIPPRQILDKYSVILNMTPEFIPESQKENVTEIRVPGSKPLSTPYRKYLAGRNYDVDYIQYKYDLHEGGTTGEQKYRVIAPVYYRNQIVTYQGRAIFSADYCDQNEIVRYKACSKPKEIIHHKHILYNIDNAVQDTVLVVEGVPSVWRLGDNCVATFGTGFTESQILLLKSRYKRVFILYDPEEDAQNKARKACEQIQGSCEAVLLRIPEVEDPGELCENDVVALKKELHIL